MRYKLATFLLGMGVLCTMWGWQPFLAHADCRAIAPPGTSTYASGTMRDHLCDANGNLLVGITGASVGGLGTNTAAAPTRSEGSAGSFSFDLSGNARVTLGTLLSGEDQTNNLLMTSGGAVRVTSLGSVTSATTSAVGVVPVGAKTFVGQIINATSETKAITVDIYGNVISSTTGGIKLCTITLPSTASVLQLQDACPITTVNFSFYFYTVTVYTSASAAPFTIYAMY